MYNEKSTIFDFQFMKIFNVYIKPSEENSLEPRPVFIQNKFYIFAFLFNSLWLIYNKIWTIAFIYFFVNILLVSIGNNYGISSTFIVFFELLMHFSLGIFAYEILTMHLKKKGYILDEVIVAKGMEDAQIEYYKRQLGEDAKHAKSI